MKTSDDQQPERIVARACDGDRAALEALWRDHRRWVAAIVLAHRPRSVEVDDLMQEVAVKFVAKIDTLRDPGAFRPWLRQIVLNACRGAARQLKPTLRLADSRDEDEHGAFTPASEQSRETAAERRVGLSDTAERVLERALTLPPEYREPLLLRCIQSLTYQQIGEILELPVTTVETRLARARRMLREEVGEEVITEGFA